MNNSFFSYLTVAEEWRSRGREGGVSNQQSAMSSEKAGSSN